MRGDVHQGDGLMYLTVVPDGYRPELDYPLVVMLHGFGANMQDLAGLAPVISRSGYVYACPNAPIAFDLGFGQVGYAWMSPQGQATPEEVSNAETLLAGFFDEVFQRFRVAQRRAILLGFSQGGGMTYRCGLPRPEAFAGLVALSASLSNPQELEARLPRERTQPIFVAHGRADSMVSLDRAARTRRFLEEAGYHPDYHEYDMGHEISGELLRDLVPWMTKVLPPLEGSI